MILNADLFGKFGLVPFSVKNGELPKLVALRSPIKNAALGAEELPQRIKILGWGENETATKGTVKVGPATVKFLAANQAAVGYDRVALDYNHNSLVGHPNYKPDPREVAAYGVPEVIAGDGLYLKDLEYTPSGLKHAREYIDLSPTPALDENGEVIFLHSTALCQQGEVKGLSFYSSDFLRTEPFHNSTKALASMDYKKLLITLLSLIAAGKKFKVKALSADATDAEIEAAASSLAEELSDSQGDGEGEGDKTAGAVEMKALAATVTNLEKTLTALNAKMEAQERVAITTEAISQGKVIPLSAKDLNLEQFRNLVKDLPADQVPLDRRTPEAIQAFSSEIGQGGGGAAEAVRVQLGIPKETWEKANAKS